MAGVGIFNFEIEKIENSSNDDPQKYFVGIFPLNKINHFIDFHNMMREKKKQNVRF